MQIYSDVIHFINDKMTSQSIPPPLQDLLSRLRFVGEIKQGDKVCIYDRSLVGRTAWFGRAKRLFMFDSRYKIIGFIEQLIDETVKSMNQYQKSPFINLITTNLKLARAGILNLQVTYQNDAFVKSSIQTCIDNIDLQFKTSNEEYVFYPSGPEDEPH